MSERLIALTDGKGRPLLPEEDMYEPTPGSVVLVNGVTGVAWQRFFSDGRWHSTTGRGVADWSYLLRQTGLLLVYEAPERKAG